MAAILLLSGCGKVGLKDPVYLPGLGHDAVSHSPSPPSPVFNNGDVVRHKLLEDKRGIMMSNRYKYFPNVAAWYCIVDFYPSSALVHFDFSRFDNYERRYVFEYELEPVDKIPARWKNMALQIK